MAAITIQNIETRLAQREECDRLLQSINQELQEKNVQTIGNLGEKLYLASGVAAGTTAGVVAALVINLLLTNPLGWSFGIGCAGIGGSCGWLFFGKYVKDYQAEAKAIESEVTKMFDHFREIPKAEQSLIVDKVNQFVCDLLKNKYLKQCDDWYFEFNDDRLKKVSEYYEKDQRPRIINELKFIILMTVAALPSGERPTDRIHAELALLTNSIANQTLASGCYFTMGLLNIDKKNYKRACECYKKIPADSPLYEIAQKTLPRLDQNVARPIEN